MIYLLLIPATLAAAGLLYQTLGTRSDRRRYRPAGRLLRVDGRTMHAVHAGVGTPTVVFDAALGASSMSWALVQPEIARHTSTFSYDRAGFGWSDEGPLPRTAGRIAGELKQLLEAAEAQPPYVLVGHSFGGLVMRIFAARHPELVAGLVFVDPAHPEEWLELSPEAQSRVQAGARLCSRGAWAARMGVARAVAALARSGRLAGARAGAGLVSGGTGVGLRRQADQIIAPIHKLPPEMRHQLGAIWTQPRFFRALGSQIEHICASATEVAQAGPLPDVPTIVLAASNQNERRMELHRRLAASQPQGSLVSVEGGHWLQFDAPEAVTRAVVEVVAKVR